jgi:hypothetical protein
MKNMLLFDDDYRIRNCPKNKKILGYWKTLYYFHSYKKIYSNISKEEIQEALFITLNLFLMTILSPILPLLTAFFDWRRSVIECKKYETQLENQK